jgi:pyrimidine operon attenuation protein / uracil phosphoribosyltransferase
MRPAETRLLDADGFERLLTDLANQIVRKRRGDAVLRLVGVRTRGVPIAERIASRLESDLGVEVPVGAVDITLYRDDFGRSARWPILRGTAIDFPVDGAEIVLVDDVLFTGRTVRAALNAICDLGRPACVRLAAVIDRGGRELPIVADYVGQRVEANPDERIVVRVRPGDSTEEVVRVAAVDDR